MLTVLLCVALAVLLVLGIAAFGYVYNRTCPECKRFGLVKDTRQYRAEDVQIVDTIIFCPSCTEIVNHYAHILGGDDL